MHGHWLIILLVVFTSSESLRAQTDNVLPRVLILGDAVYQQPASEAAKELKGRVEVVAAVRLPGEVLSTSTVMSNLDRLLGHLDRDGKPLPHKDRPRWDVIVFNCGLSDLIHRAPNMKSLRVMPIQVGGRRNTHPEQYQQNLDELVRMLKATDAQIIWASTTPIRASTSNVFELGSEIQYNALAAPVMADHGVPTIDMYGYVKQLIDMDKPASHGADPFFFDRKPIHPPIVEAIKSALGLTPKQDAETPVAVPSS